ncbi:MAG TPA: DNRLRE domain-containing protein [Myxococcus sp.]|nr:DNRLRE domain-containing protein [Myxococcus sp.]
MGIGGKWGWKTVGALAALVLLPRCDGGPGAGDVEPARQPASTFVEDPESPPVEAPVPEAPASTARAHTFPAVADGSVDAAQPERRMGGDETLQVDALPAEARAYTRFEVTGLSGRVTRATLRLYAFSGTADGPAVYRVQGPWTEADLRFNLWAMPGRYGAALDDAGPISSGTWVELDVTGAVAGNGVHEFGLFATSADGVDFDSRESRHEARRPQLVVETGSAPPDDCAPVSRPDTRIIYPLADEAVHEDTADAPPWVGSTLRVDASPVRFESFLHFDLEHDRGGPIVSAKLRLFATNGSVDGPELHHAGGSSWNWGSLTWNRRPQAQRLLADLGEVPANGWVEVDVTGLVKGGEDFTFALLPSSEDGVEFRASATDIPGLWPHLLITRAAPGCRFRGTGGAIDWTRQRGGPGDETVSAMATAEDGTSFVVAGRFSGGGDFGGGPLAGERGLVVARYAQDGSHQWSRALAVGARAEVTGLSVTTTGHVLLVGEYHGALDLGTGALPFIEDTASGLFVARLSPQGEPLWAHGFRAEVRSPDAGVRAGMARAQAVGTDFMGSLIVTGVFQGSLNLGGGLLHADPGSPPVGFPAPGLFLARFQADGRHVWSISMPGDILGTVPQALSTDGQGFIYVGGTTASRLLGATRAGTPFIAKFSWNGTPQWVRALNGAEGGIRALAALPGGGVGFAGDLRGTFSFGGHTLTSTDPVPASAPDDVVVGTLKASGQDGWVRMEGGPHSEGAYSLGVDVGGALVVGGWTRADTLELGGGQLGGGGAPPAGAVQHFVARYGPDGTHRWSRLLGVKGPERVPLQVAPDGRTRLGIPFEGAFDPGSGSATSRGARDVLFLQLAP